MSADQLVGHRRGEIGLVEHQQLGHRPGADLDEHLVHRSDLALGVGHRYVDHVHQIVGHGSALERALERLDQTMRQAADESDRVGDQHRLAAGEREPAGRRIEGGEQAGSR